MPKATEDCGWWLGWIKGFDGIFRSQKAPSSYLNYNRGWLGSGRFQALVVLFVVGMSAQAADVVWNFGSTTPGTTSPTSGTPVANLTVAGITQGTIATTSGSGTSPTYTGNSAGYNIGFTAKAGVLDITAGTGSAYFEFSLTPSSGYSFLLSAVSFGSRSTSTGPKNLTLRSSVDNYASEIGITAPALSDSSWGIKNFGVLSLTSSALTTFRIYGYNGTGAAGSGNWRVDDVKISVAVISGPVVYANGSLNPFSNTSGTASGEQTFSVSGYNLTGDLTVTPPAGFEIKTAGDYTSSPLAILRSGVSVAPTTVTVRVAAATPANPSLSGNLTVSSSGASDKTLAVNGTVSPDTSPFISVSTNVLPAFSASSGSVSASQSFTTAAKNLTNEFTVTAPGGFQVSTNGVDFSNSLSLAQTNGLSANTVSVRVAGTNSASGLSGYVVMASAGASSANVAVNATVTNPTITVSMNPALMYENATSTGTVTLPARITDLIINLNSGTTSAATVPSSVILPAGQTSVDFTATGVTDSGYAEKSTVIAASAANCTQDTATLIVLNADTAPITPIALDGSNSNSYSQNFNGLGTNLVSKVIPGSNGVSVSLGAVTSSNLNGWYATKNSGTGTVATDISTNTNSSTGTLYNFGALGNSDRSLGGIATGTTAVSFGALITNTTGGTIANLKLSLKGEFWRSSTGLSNNVLTFGYGKINGTTVNTSNFLTVSSNISSLVGLNINGPAPVAVSGSSNGPLDGNDPANQVTLSNVSIPLILQAGESAFLRWADVKEGSYDAGLSIDDFVLTYDVDRTLTLSSFTPSVGPEATQVTIRGANFAAGMPVKFNGTAASLFSVVSSTELLVTVPAGATTGYITVGEGSAAVTSATAFVVGNFSGDPTASGADFGSISVGNVADKYFQLNGGGLPGETIDFVFDKPDFLLSEDGSTFTSTLSVALSSGSVSYVFPAARFAPTSTGAQTAVLTVSSGGVVIGKYTFTGSGTGLAQPKFFSGYGQNGQAALSWSSDPSYDLVILGKDGSSVAADAPTASGSYTGNSSFGSGTQVGSSTTIFSGLDSSVSNKVVTGLNNNQFYYFKIFNRNPSANAVSAGKEIRVMPYADITSGVITRWNFNNSDLSPSTGVGAVGVVGGAGTGFVNGVTGSSDRAAVNRAVSVKGVAGQFTGLQFAVSTLGKKEVKVFWDIAASGSASKYTRFQYTLDVTATPPVWVDYNPGLQDSPGVTPAAGGLYVLDVAESTLLQRSADLSSKSGVENNAKFGFRVTSAYAPGTSAIARADGTSAAYSTVGTVKYDMVTVAGASMQAQTPFESWVAGYPSLTGANALGTADPDGDGMINSAEFAFGTSPVSGASRAVTQTSVAGGIKITWLQRSGVTYAVKSTDNLGSAFSVPVLSSPVSPQPGGLGDYEQYEATLTGGDRGFIQVEATVP